MASFDSSSFTPASFSTSLDLQEPISITLKNFIKSNWPATSILNTSQIKFGNKWWDDLSSFQIHFRDSNIRDRYSNISWAYVQVSHYVDIHIWVRMNQITRPPQIDDIKRNVSAVIETNKRNLPITAPNNTSMHVIREFDMKEQSPLQTLWHSVVQAEVRYWRASTDQ